MISCSNARRVALVIVAVSAASLLVILPLRRCWLSQPGEAWYGELHIVGSRGFVIEVVSALRLLERESPAAFELAKTHLDVIQEDKRSGVEARESPVILSLSYRSASHSATWCAGAISHEAYHVKLYRDYADIHEGPVPYQAWGTDRESQCIRYQLDTLRALGAPAKEIDYLAAMKPDFYDLDRDGQYTPSDYELRDW